MQSDGSCTYLVQRLMACRARQLHVSCTNTHTLTNAWRRQHVGTGCWMQGGYACTAMRYSTAYTMYSSAMSAPLLSQYIEKILKNGQKMRERGHLQRRSLGSCRSYLCCSSLCIHKKFCREKQNSISNPTCDTDDERTK